MNLIFFSDAVYRFFQNHLPSSSIKKRFSIPFLMLMLLTMIIHIEAVVVQRKEMAAEESVCEVDLFAKDVPELLGLMEEFKAQLSNVMASVDHLLTFVNEMDTAKGIDFLEAKYHIFLDYIINIVQVILLKVDGQSIEEHPAIERLIETRILLEKMRPTEQRIKYQIDKLVKLAKSGTTSSGGSSGPLSFKPNPQNMISKMEDEGESSEEEKETKGIYVPPKVSAVPYEDDTAEGMKRKHEEKRKLKSLNKSLLKELREEYSETPEEIKDDYQLFRKGKSHEKDLEKERYEEENLIRLSHSKKIAKNESNLKDLAKFDSFGFDSDSDEDGQFKAKRMKRSKLSTKGKKIKKKFAGKKKRKLKR